MVNQYTIADVAKHNKEGDMWVAIHGKVYDVRNLKITIHYH